MSKPETKTHPQYSVRRVQLGRTAQLDELAHACGQVYSRTLLFFWRTVRHKGIWLKPRHLMRLIPADPDHLLHAHSVDAAVQAFFAGLASWRERHSMDPNAKPPRRRKWYFKVEYKSSAIRLHESLLILSNGRENAPLVLFWQWDLPKTVVIHWTGSQYEAIATYQIGKDPAEEEEVSLEERRAEHSVGIDLGEVHPAVSCDGQHAHLLNGRLLRSKRQYRNKLLAKMDAKIARCKRGGQRRIPIEEIARLRRRGEGKQGAERCVLYARISSGRQEQDGNLARQSERLKEAARARGYEVVQIITEHASSLNERRKGMNRLLSLIGGQATDVVLVEYPDRLVRFGLSYLEQAFGWMGVRLEVLDPPKQLEPSEELVQDLLTIVTVFAGRLYGHRAKGIRTRVQTALQECEATPVEGTDGTSQQDHQTAHFPGKPEPGRSQ